MKRPLAGDERTALAAVKKDILDAKRELRAAMRGLTALVDRYHDEGFEDAEAAAMDMRGTVMKALGELDQGHSRAMKALCDCFDDGGVVIQGGGGR